MDKDAYNGALKQAMPRRIREAKTVTAAAVPKYPEQTQREYKRVSNEYMKLVQETFKEYKSSCAGRWPSGSITRSSVSRTLKKYW